MFDIEFVKRHIEENKFNLFAVSESSFPWCNYNVYCIYPITMKGDLYIRRGAVFDNFGENGIIPMSKEEFILKFQLIFGYDVVYNLNDDTGELEKL
jgi:hypothetical protein